MTFDARALLPLYVLGILDGDEAIEVERAAAGDPALAAELAALQATTEALVVPVAPSPEVQARLLASIGDGRFEARSIRMASLFDVTVDRARELLGLIERPASWIAAMPGVALVHFDGGPACATADCGFVRLAPGAAFPHHTHLGQEVSLILAGTLRDLQTGHLLGPGDEATHAQDTAHDVVCEGDGECIYAARVTSGIAIAGAAARPPGKP